jgi:predicted transcriptional regulator
MNYLMGLVCMKMIWIKKWLAVGVVRKSSLAIAIPQNIFIQIWEWVMQSVKNVILENTMSNYDNLELDELISACEEKDEKIEELEQEIDSMKKQLTKILEDLNNIHTRIWNLA